MALSGTIGSLSKENKSTTTSNGYIDAIITWSATQSIEGNYSDVTATLKYSRNNTGYTTGGTWNGSITINGTKTTGSKFIKITYNSNTVAMSATTRVYHDDDGSKSITISASGKISGTTLKSTNISDTVTLTTIPRASSISSLTSSVEINGSNQVTVNISRNSTSFTHTVRFYINDTYTKTISDVGTSTSYAIPTSWLKAMPSSDSITATCLVTTYNGDTKIGSAVSKSFKLVVPSSIVPSIGTITLDPANITTVDGTSRNILVQEKNKITFSASGCTAGSGSSIKSYKFDVLSGSTIIATTTTTSASATFGPFSKTGALKFRLTVTDKRGRSTSNKDKEPTWTCYAYDPPSFSSFTAYRCNSSGTADDNGTYVKYSFKVNYSSVNSTNKSTVKIYYKQSENSSWTAASNALTNSTTTSASNIIKNSSGTEIIFSISSTYSVYATVIDNYNGSVNSSSVTLFSASRVFNIRKSGEGIAFGKLAESDNLFESKWPAKFNDGCSIDGGLTVGTSTQSSTPIGGITVHDVRNADITPDSFGDKNANFYFDQISSRWQSILHMKGWTGDYAAWELAGNAHNSSNDNTLKYRQGIGDTWGDWQTVLTDKNIKNYANTSNYLPLSGGTLTGKLILDSNLYYASGDTAGLDCQNSDIINANAIYFKDASDSAGEAINFYRGSGTWDTLYAYDGKLKFHPNRATSTALGGYTIYNSSNFRRGTCTLSSSGETTITFSSALGGTPTVMLTPLTDVTGVIAGKLRSVSATGFTAVIGGSSGTTAKFAYLAIYY